MKPLLLSLFLALPLACATAPKPAPPEAEIRALPFIHDDYARALAEARNTNRPLFVDTWAPWCHTCLFMRNYVLSDEGLLPDAKRFVWLSIDTERPENAVFLERFPQEVWPTLYVIDPRTEKAALKWPGSATVAELRKLLDDGAQAANPSPERESTPEDKALARADRLSAERKAREAANAYEEAIRLGGPGWPRKGRAAASLALGLMVNGDYEACAASARTHAPALPRDVNFANVASVGLGCALSAPSAAAWRKDAIASLEPLTVEALALPGLLADDRSGIYETLADLRSERGDKAGTKALAAEWLNFLESEAAKARTPEARATFDPHRVNAALVLGDPARTIPALQATERDLPDDYNAPARLALLYRELGRHMEALAAIERAQRKVYGPRRIRLLEIKASIHEKLGDRAATRRAFEEALRVAESLPKAQQSDKTIARLKSAIAKVG